MKLSPLRIAGLALAAILILLAGLGIYFVVMPKDALIAEIEKRLEAATQRDVTIGRPVRFSFYPALGFSAPDVVLANPEGFSDAPFLRADRIVFALALMPLLKGAYEVDSLVLDHAELNLEAGKDGAVNWTFPTEAAGEDQSATIDDLKLEGLRFIDGRMSFAGPDGAAPVVLDHIDASMDITSLDQASKLAAAFDYRGERLDLDAVIGAPRALIERGTTPLAITLRAEPLAGTFEGTLDAAAASLTGALDVKGASMRRLLAWMGAPLEQGGGFGPFRAKARISHAGDTTVLDNAALNLDALAASGRLTFITREKANLRVTGALTVRELDLNPYLPAPTQGAGGPGVEAGAAWTTAPIDLSGLKSLDADLRLSVGALKFQRLSFTDVSMRLGVASAVADARLERISLYGGAGTARFVADARARAPKIAVELDASNVQALPLLRDAIGFETLEGRGRLVARLAGAGASQAEIMRSLAGEASFNLSDGAVKGFNLASVARTVQSILSGDAAGPSSATDFAEFAADFRVNNGVAATDNLRLLNPFIRMDGAGLIDIGAQPIDMRIAPRAVNAIEGQGGAADVAGIGVPFRVSGPWSRPSFKAALGDVVRNELRDRARDALAKQGGDSPLGVLAARVFGLGPDPAEEPPAQPQQQQSAPADAAQSPAPAEPPPAEKQAPQSVEDELEQRARDALGGLFKNN